MNKHIKEFLHRGLIFGGFGPITLGIVFTCIELGGIALSLSGGEILLAIISTYVLAFTQAGASVFNQIEEWPITKSLLCHFSLLFAVYSLTYIINSWIPFEPLMLLIFLLVFVVIYFTVWLSVYFSVKAHTRRLNSRLK
jgi:hypothetical protein